ncbi:roadblock/LC7 domain-containing protein [Streptomyces roseirectus]|uniref:Roadblock/LC7 domain-containing protein n=1 Tax=Streptomyces roseirectus TaxID=2768066 RepID=A0A7H0I9S0_9ACTN|nr:roadblock/LC7 domain-containing protein [Streptomyces roseirectus]QNP69536.1 roadblock/LC7 domain-containing protein [Streptomyces roseirectus]
MSTSTGDTPAGEATPTDLRAAAADFTWLLNRFATETAGVVDAIAVSSDGLLIAVSELREHADSERLAAIVSGITSLAAGASGNYGLGGLNKVIIDLEGGHVLVSSIGSGAVLGVVTDKEAKLGNIAYEMTVFANRAGSALSPQLVLELKNTVGAAKQSQQDRHRHQSRTR